MPPSLAKAIECRLRIGDDTMAKMYEHLSKKGAKTIYDAAKGLGWSYGKALYAINKLREINMVQEVQEVSNGRFRRLVRAQKWHEPFDEGDMLKLIEEARKEGYIKS